MTRAPSDTAMRHIQRLAYGGSAMAVVAIALLALAGEGMVLAIAGLASVVIAVTMVLRAVLLTRGMKPEPPPDCGQR